MGGVAKREQRSRDREWIGEECEKHEVEESDVMGLDVARHGW